MAQTVPTALIGTVTPANKVATQVPDESMGDFEKVFLGDVDAVDRPTEGAVSITADAPESELGLATDQDNAGKSNSFDSENCDVKSFGIASWDIDPNVEIREGIHLSKDMKDQPLNAKNGEPKGPLPALEKSNSPVTENLERRNLSLHESTMNTTSALVEPKKVSEIPSEKFFHRMEKEANVSSRELQLKPGDVTKLSELKTNRDVVLSEKTSPASTLITAAIVKVGNHQAHENSGSLVGEKQINAPEPSKVPLPRYDIDRPAMTASQPQDAAAGSHSETRPLATHEAAARLMGLNNSNTARGREIHPIADLLGTATQGQSLAARPVSPSQNAGATQLSYATPETAKSIANQMLIAVTQSAGGKTEIQLSPAELGRVKLVLSPQEAGIVVSVAAERPEIHDLMRRHVDVLAQEFSQMGYESLSFEFGNSHDHESSGGTGDETSMIPAESTSRDEDAPLRLSLLKTSGLDLRL